MSLLVLTKSGGILSPIALVLGFVIDGIYIVLSKMGITNVALTIAVFTVIINIAMIPMTIKQQKSSKLMARVNPEINKIREKYKGKNDPQSMRRMQAEQRMVYDRYGASMTGGCGQMIIMIVESCETKEEILDKLKNLSIIKNK